MKTRMEILEELANEIRMSANKFVEEGKPFDIEKIKSKYKGLLTFIETKNTTYKKASKVAQNVIDNTTNLIIEDIQNN